MTTPSARGVRRTPVGISQLAVSSDPADVLVAYGLGSCVGVAAYDPVARVGALAHVLLSDAHGREADPQNPARFADHAIELLIARLAAAGAQPLRLVVKLAGGAAVLGPESARKFKIGERNAEAITEHLKRRGLTVAAHDLGGTRGRTLELHVGTGLLTVRTAASGPAAL